MTRPNLYNSEARYRRQLRAAITTIAAILVLIAILALHSVAYREDKPMFKPLPSHAEMRLAQLEADHAMHLR